LININIAKPLQLSAIIAEIQGYTSNANNVEVVALFSPIESEADLHS
jgi:hypothetical protein